jgi:hypothetical protein
MEVIADVNKAAGYRIVCAAAVTTTEALFKLQM